MAWVVVTRELALLVWEDLEGQKRPVEITEERGLSERTVQRLGMAITGFKNHRPDGSIAMATGWSRQRISELKDDWREDLALPTEVVGPQRQADGSGSRPDQQKTLQDWVQLEDVKELLLDPKLELAPFSSNFPTVWKGFRPDPSNRLKWVGEGDSGTEPLPHRPPVGHKTAGQSLRGKPALSSPAPAYLCHPVFDQRR